LHIHLPFFDSANRSPGSKDETFGRASAEEILAEKRKAHHPEWAMRR